MTYDPAQNPRKRHRGPDPKERYKGVYMAVLNKLIDQITTRFANIENQGFLRLLNSASFQEMSDTFPTEAFECLLKGYGQLFESDRLQAELQVLYSDSGFHSGKDKLCDFIAFFKQGGLDKVMTEVYRLMCLIATIGVTSAGVERSFSCLQRLKTYTRNTIGQERLQNLAVVAIERRTVKSLEGTPRWYDSY